MRSTAHFFVATLAVATAIAACESSSDPTTPDTGTTVASVAVSVPATTVTMPDVVQATATVSPSNAPQTVTWSSSDPSTASVNSQGQIQPLLQGPVVITATSTADGTKSGSVTLNIVCPAPRDVTSNVDGDTTWENWIPDPTCYDYRVQTVVSMNDETLTIEPGTRVGFGADEWLRVVADDAALVAAGSAAEPIVLTAYESTAPGFWQGVQFENSLNTVNRLDHVVVEYAGSDPINTLPGANIEIRGDSRVSISNSTLRHSQGFGIYAPNTSLLDDFGGNTLTMNGSHPAYLSARLIGGLMAGNTFTGNAIDEIRVETGTNNHLDEDATWLNHGVPYYMQHLNGKEWDVAGVTLTLEPGISMLFGDDLGVSVEHGGELVAVGTADAPISMAAKNDLWQGLRFFDGMGTIDHASIVDAGSESFGSNERAAVTVVTVDIQNAPESRVDFGSNVTLSGTDYEIAFGLGDTYATGCQGRIFRDDHCLP